MSHPLVSLCIPTYNRAPKLRRLLDALAAEEAVADGSIAVLVSDNASDDDTGDVLREFGARVPGLRTHRQPENIGADRNIRWCIAAADDAPYLWCFCDDDLPEPGAVGRVLELLREHEPDWLHLPHRWCNADGETVHASPCPETLEGFDGSAAVFRRYHHWLGFMTASVHRRERLQPTVSGWRTENAYNPLLWAFVSHLHGPCLVADRTLIVAGPEVSWDAQRVEFTTEHYVRLHEHGLRLGLSAEEFAAALDSLYDGVEYLDYWREAPREALASALAAFPHSRRLRVFAWELAREEDDPSWFARIDAAAHVSGAATAAAELTARGEDAFTAGDAATALACFQHAVELHPTRAVAWNDVGVVLHALGDARAAEAFALALALDPEYADARTNAAALAA